MSYKLQVTSHHTLCSWMSVNGTRARARSIPISTCFNFYLPPSDVFPGTSAREVFYEIPCGWNRQIGTHMTPTLLDVNL